MNLNDKENLLIKIDEIKEENARLREAVSGYQKSFDMEKRLFDITVKELREENARLHVYKTNTVIITLYRERWKWEV